MKEKIYCLKGEIWRDVIGYEGLYQVSNYGRVASLNYHRSGRWHLLNQELFKGGYLRVQLYKDGKATNKMVHRLVAEAFPEICGEWFEGAEVDHINTIRDDNRAINLRWVTRSENHLNPITRKRISYAHCKPVLQFTKDSVLIAEYKSARDAQKQTGIYYKYISACCRGKSKSAGGFVWKLKETEAA